MVTSSGASTEGSTVEVTSQLDLEKHTVVHQNVEAHTGVVHCIDRRERTLQREEAMGQVLWSSWLYTVLKERLSFQIRRRAW